MVHHFHEYGAIRGTLYIGELEYQQGQTSGDPRLPY
jgi:hypothetical protein